MEISKILIGIDNSKYAQYAAEYGFNLARKLNAAVGLVTIVEPLPASIAPSTDTAFGLPFEGNAGIDNVELMNVQDEVASNTIENTVKKFGEGLSVTTYTDFGGSADGIINCCAQFGADLIVIGNHARSGFDRLLMGSVAEDVVRHAKVPVLVVPMVDVDE
jgi:nucleotide-binding universal stress UspA family protein